MAHFEWQLKDRRESAASVTILENQAQTMTYSKNETVEQVQVPAGEEYLYSGLC